MKIKHIFTYIVTIMPIVLPIGYAWYISNEFMINGGRGNGGGVVLTGIISLLAGAAAALILSIVLLIIFKKSVSAGNNSDIINYGVAFLIPTSFHALVLLYVYKALPASAVYWWVYTFIIPVVSLVSFFIYIIHRKYA